jgi:hypothetical protein
MAKIRVYPHNDLLNLANYQRGMINNKIENGIQDAIKLDCMSCLISLAFAVEALVNFVGFKRVRNWRERRPYREKIGEICRIAGFEFDESQDPFSTIWALKIDRDLMAHGQPFEGSLSVSNREELRNAMECPWDQHLNPDYVNHAYNRVKEFERRIFEALNISIADSLTSSIGAGL